MTRIIMGEGSSNWQAPKWEEMRTTASMQPPGWTPGTEPWVDAKGRLEQQLDIEYQRKVEEIERGFRQGFSPNPVKPKKKSLIAKLKEWLYEEVQPNDRADRETMAEEGATTEILSGTEQQRSDMGGSVWDAPGGEE